MKHYPSIPGWRDAPHGNPCLGFYKYDGSCLRFEWSKKAGWYKSGSRNVLMDETQEDLGLGIELFENKYGDAIPKVLCDDKEFRGIDRCIVFVEFFGPHSFAGFHEPTDPKDVVLIDVNPHKRGILPPRVFIKHFGHLHIPAVVYEGNFNRQLVQDVQEGKYPVEEGVVAKGLLPHGKPPHNLWMAKIKTRTWLEQLKQKAEYIEALKKVLADNLQEQRE